MVLGPHLPPPEPPDPATVPMSMRAIQEEAAPAGGDLFSARREATEAIRNLVDTPAAAGLREYAERAQAAADALNNLASLAWLAVRREQQ